LTSDAPGLGASDAESRWIGIRRHQALAVVAGLGLAGDWLLRPGARVFELVIGLALVGAAAPVGDGLTVLETVGGGARFAARPGWTRIEVRRGDAAMELSARGSALVHGYRLAHRGRLDLSGRDLHDARGLASLLDAVATADSTRHLSVHVSAGVDGCATWLALSDASAPPGEWNRDEGLVAAVAGVAPGGGAWLLERWAYVRLRAGVASVLRVRDFSACSASAMLEQLQRPGDGADVAVHYEVLSARRAQGLAQRAVHRHGIDGAAASAAGFRRTARSERSLARLALRERQVAAGRALVRVGVFVTVRADTRPQLARRVDRVTSAARAAGLRLERGHARQAEWYCQQLPGGPGW
jgi:hypothetical protein